MKKKLRKAQSKSEWKILDCNNEGEVIKKGEKFIITGIKEIKLIEKIKGGLKMKLIIFLY